MSIFENFSFPFPVGLFSYPCPSIDILHIILLQMYFSSTCLIAIFEKVFLQVLVRTNQMDVRENGKCWLIFMTIPNITNYLERFIDKTYSLMSNILSHRLTFITLKLANN